MKDIEFTVFSDSHDRWGRKHSLPWDVLAERLARHDEALEKDGSAICCALFDNARSSEAAHTRTLLAFDIEAKPNRPPDPEVFAGILAIKKRAAVIWTTFSHTSDDPHYRVIMPLDEPIPIRGLPPRLEPMITGSYAWEMQLHGNIDTGKFGAASLMYLARHKPGAPHFSRVIPGGPLNAKNTLAIATMIFSDARMKKAQLDALRHTTEFPPELRALMDVYNESHELPDLFSQYGYQRHGMRWKSRYQAASSNASTSIFPDHQGWYSWSDSDRAAGLGHPSDDGGAFGDAFELFRHYEHGGNFRDAIAALRERYANVDTGSS